MITFRRPAAPAAVHLWGVPRPEWPAGRSESNPVGRTHPFPHMLGDHGYTTEKIYTDGSSHGNPGCGGWAWAVTKDEYVSSASSNIVTNQRLELLAVIKALEDIHDDYIEIVSDSAYIVNCFKDNWQKGNRLSL